MKDGDSRTAIGAMMLLAGGAVGAGLALLYAPQTGKRTRKTIARYGRQVRNDTERRIRDAAETLTEMVEDAGDKTKDLMDDCGDVAEDWRNYLLHTYERGQKNLERQRKQLLKRWS